MLWQNKSRSNGCLGLSLINCASRRCKISHPKNIENVMKPKFQWNSRLLIKQNNLHVLSEVSVGAPVVWGCWCLLWLVMLRTVKLCYYWSTPADTGFRWMLRCQSRARALRTAVRKPVLERLPVLCPSCGMSLHWPDFVRALGNHNQRLDLEVI